MERSHTAELTLSRLLEPIGNIPPAEAEEHYYATLDQPAIAA
jgi:putative transposase